jgi:hypothetical protein
MLRMHGSNASSRLRSRQKRAEESLPPDPAHGPAFLTSMNAGVTSVACECFRTNWIFECLYPVYTRFLRAVSSKLAVVNPVLHYIKAPHIDTSISSSQIVLTLRSTFAHRYPIGDFSCPCTSSRCSKLPSSYPFSPSLSLELLSCRIFKLAMEKTHLSRKPLPYWISNRPLIARKLRERRKDQA